MAFDDYFEYERQIAVANLIPSLKVHSAWPAARILDVGCGYGGTLAAFKSADPACDAVGLDLDAEMVQQGLAKSNGALRLIHADFFQWQGSGFDLILMRDVLEHIRRMEEALRKAATLLAPGGRIYASFAPYFGPFGGHQQNGAGLFSHCPWIHWLPQRLFARLVPVAGNSYKSLEALRADMDSVADTRLTVAGFKRAARSCGLILESLELFLSRPDYKFKFGWPACRFPDVPILSEIFSTGVEALLIPGRAAK
jgi:SAM-dependent methyltransferase